MPFPLTLAFLHSWAAPLAVAVSLSTASVSLVLVFGRNDTFGLASLRQGLPFVIAYLLTAVILLGIVLAQGTTLSAAIAGIVARPAKMVSLFFLLLELPHSTIQVCIFGLSAIAYVFAVRRWPRNRMLSTSLLVAKILWSATILYLAFTEKPIAGAGLPALLISWFAPFSWLLLAGNDNTARASFPRVLLLTAALLEILLIYPVAGSQHAFSTFLFVPAAVMAMADALSDLAPDRGPCLGSFEFRFARNASALDSHVRFLRSSREASSPLLSRSANAMVSLLLLLAFGIYGYPRISSGKGVRHTYKNFSFPTYFPGAERLHVSFQWAGIYHWIVANTQANCDAFFTEPGMGSLHLWSEIPPLTGMNLTVWMQFLTLDEHQQIINKLDRQNRVCVLANPGYAAWWVRFKNEFLSRPLPSYIDRNFHTVAVNNFFELRFRNGRQPPRATSLLFKPTRFNGQPGYALPPGLTASEHGNALSLWFQTRGHGALFGCQDSDNLTGRPAASAPVLWLDKNGRLNGAAALPSLNDGQWHQIVLLPDENPQRFWLDGVMRGSLPESATFSGLQYCELGDAYVPGTPLGHWLRFRGAIARAEWMHQPLSDEELRSAYQRERSTLPAQ